MTGNRNHPNDHRGPAITWSRGHSLEWRELFYTIVDRYRVPEIELYKHIREMALLKLKDFDGWDERIVEGEFSSFDGTTLDYDLNIERAHSLFVSDVNKAKRFDTPNEIERVYNNALGWAVFWSVRHPTLSLRKLWDKIATATDAGESVVMTDTEWKMFYEAGEIGG